jgi:hypothetical protein
MNGGGEHDRAHRHSARTFYTRFATPLVVLEVGHGKERQADQAAVSRPQSAQTWCELEICLQAYNKQWVDGIGFALHQSDIGAIDIDDCRNKETGDLHPWAAAVIARSKTYCEVTPSQEGIRVIGRCAGSKVHRKLNVADGVSCELYRVAERYITISGQQIGDVSELGNIDELIDTLLLELDSAKQSKQKKSASKKATGNGSGKHDLASLIKDGCGSDFGGDRSRAVWYVINQLLKRGDDSETIVATILDPNNGISAHCFDQSNPEVYARRQVENAQQQREKDDSSDDDAEIERLAKLPLLEYDRARKAAAEKLGVRATMLERLVKAKRAELGLNGDGNGLQGSTVTFEEIEPWPEPVDGAQLLANLAAIFREYVVMSDYERDICAVWNVHTYLIKHFRISPKLSIKSPVKECGKSTLLELLSYTVYRPWGTESITAAALFRVIEKWHPTLLIDEVDTFVGGNEELRGMLNASHRYDGAVTRTVGDDHEPRRFSVYAPIALSGIGGLADTLANRSVSIVLKRRLPNESIKQLRIGRMGHLEELRRRIVRWVADRAERIAAHDPRMPASIVNREADNWQVLLAIADEAGGQWPEWARKAAESHHVAVAADDTSRLELLLGDIRGIFAATEGLDKITSETGAARR